MKVQSETCYKYEFDLAYKASLSHLYLYDSRETY